MGSQIQQEIKQSLPFKSSRHEALVALIRTTDQIKRSMAEVFSNHDITLQQYNVLRILRGARPDGLPTMEIRERMLEIAPGVTRLVDRLEQSRLVERSPRVADRRCVVCRITSRGLKVLDDLDDAVDERDAKMLRSLANDEVESLIRLLDRVRAGIRGEI